MADPRPEKRPEIEPIRVLVRGATTHEMPSPNRSENGRMSMNTSIGGTSVDGIIEGGPPGRRIERDPGVPQQPEGHQQRAGDEEAARAQPPGEGADPGRQERQHDPAGDPDDARAERRVAEDALEDHRLIEERDVQRAVDEERGEVDRRERA